jgi:predicted small lipoprotein YifL
MNKQFQKMLAALIPLILFGCGQKGALTLPTPQFPAPADNAPAKPNNAR